LVQSALKGRTKATSEKGIVDYPASIQVREAWLLRNGKALALVRRGLQDATDGKTVTYRDVAALAEDVSMNTLGASVGRLRSTRHLRAGG
jgi:hypothetical protein